MALSLLTAVPASATTPSGVQARAHQADSVFAGPLARATVAIPPDIRNADSPADMTADRIPPRVGTDVTIRVDIPTGEKVTLLVEGGGNGNGTVLVNGQDTYVLSESGIYDAHVRLVGQTQTDAGRGPRLRLVARQLVGRRDVTLGESKPFAVSAIPQNFTEEFYKPCSEYRAAKPRGIVVNVDWQSDSGFLHDLDQVVMTELVQVVSGAEGAASGYNTPGNRPRALVPDEHCTALAAIVPGYSRLVNQAHLFIDRRSMSTDVAVTDACYRISRAANAAGTMLTTSKSGLAAGTVAGKIRNTDRTKTVDCGKTGAGRTEPAAGITRTEAK